MNSNYHLIPIEYAEIREDDTIVIGGLHGRATLVCHENEITTLAFIPELPAPGNLECKPVYCRREHKEIGKIFRAEPIKKEFPTIIVALASAAIGLAVYFLLFKLAQNVLPVALTLLP